MSDLIIMEAKLISPNSADQDRRGRILVKARSGKKTRFIYGETNKNDLPQDGFTDDYMELHAVFPNSHVRFAVGDTLVADVRLERASFDEAVPQAQGA